MPAPAIPVNSELPEFVVTSKTQTAEQIKQALQGRGYNDFQVNAGEVEPPAEPSPEPEPPAEPAETTVEDNEEPETPPAEPPPSPAKESSSKKYQRQRNEARLERDRLAAKVKELEESVKLKVTPPAAAPPPEPEPTFEIPPKPKFEDFSDSEDAMEAWATARDEWRDKVRDIEKRKTDFSDKKERTARESVTAEQQRIQQERFEAWRKIGTEKFGDEFQAKISKTPSMSRPLATMITSAERSHELAMWVGDHPQEVAEIVKLTTLPDNATPEQIQTALYKASKFVTRIEASLPEPPASDTHDDDDDQAEEDAGATPPAPAAPPKPAQPPAPPAGGSPPPKKMTPPSPTKSRSGGPVPKRISDMTPAEVSALHPDDYRRMREGK